MTFPYLSFLDTTTDYGVALPIQYNLLLVAISYLIAGLGSLATLLIGEDLGGDRQDRSRRLWLMLGATAMGLGVWAMHFVGMLALNLPLRVRYDITVTLVSVVPAIVAGGICLMVIARPAVSASQLFAAGITMGLGIGAMHYTGMAAMRVSADMRYDPVLFVLSLVIAAAFAVGALYAMFRIRAVSFTGKAGILVLSSAVMALAVTGMHYTGMWAVYFFPTASADAEPAGLASATIAQLMVLAAIIIIALAIAAILMRRYLRIMRAIEAQLARVTNFLEYAPDAALAVDRLGKIVFMNTLTEALFGYSKEELLGQPIDMLIPEEPRKGHSSHLSAYFQSPTVRTMGAGLELSGLRKDGTQVPVEISLSPIEIEGETLVMASVRDLTARKQAETQFRVLADRLRLATESAEIGIWDWHITTDTLVWDDCMYALYGIGPEEFDGSAFEFWEKKVHPNDIARTRAEIAEAIAGSKNFDTKFRVVHPDGTIRHIEGHGRVQRAADGTAVRMIGVNWDVTDRQKLEGQLRQAQKMEAVGQLTGGIAHDFNDLLTVILGNLQVIEGHLKRDESLHAAVQAALDAGFRGAELTKRLLTFSRQQQLEPRVMDINKLVLEIEPLLKRTLSENIILKIRLAEGLWLAEVDPSQMENSLVNLAVNARDAMPDGGMLTIETANTILDDVYAGSHSEVAPGDYVLVTVSDTGTGIPDDVLENVFEPFFSTKEVGKGTGLGLSMVYGFIIQSKGYIDIYSEEGHGTTLKLYLPRSVSATESSGATSSSNKGISATGHETILVVEDQAAVRQIAVSLLKTLGYRLLEASTGAEALVLLDERRDIDLLFTDMVMPGGMTGTELVAQARERDPNLKVVYTSGFTATVILGKDAPQSRELMLSKPYRKEELARTVREALDQAE